MSQPAARVGDMHVCPMVTPGTPPVPHVGGPVLPPGGVTVLIGNMPAARMGDMCTCVGPPDVIVQGAFNVLICNQPAARMGDMTSHGGSIAIGCPTVLIGTSPGGGGVGSPAAPSIVQQALDAGNTLVTEAFDDFVDAAEATWDSLESTASDAAEVAAGMWDALKGKAADVWQGATSWHFEGRDAANGPHPNYSEVTEPGSDWLLLPEEMSIYHDNGEGEPELKYVNSDGREAVFDGDTLEPITDPRYVGTYNYVVPTIRPDSALDLGGWIEYVGKGAGHLVADVLPYYAGGNVRGEN